MRCIGSSAVGFPPEPKEPAIIHQNIMSRLVLPAAGFLILVLAIAAQSPSPIVEPPASFTVVEATIADMQAAMREGRTSSREIVQRSLTRIAMYEDRLNAAITVNSRALDEADERDRERRQGRVRGPLHGIPVALKDNIHTTDMRTTGGALAFAELVPPYEATLTRNLRDAGAIIIAKTVLTELANWVATGMPTNYSALAGFAFNPYDPRRDPRDAADGRPVLATGGSSSGIGTASSFWAANVGTETSGSILSPSNQNMLVGIKPTVGRISRYGVIPIAAEQDTPGPMARTVADAAILLGALESASPDPNDPGTGACSPPPGRDYTRYLRPGALKGARIGIPRAFYYEPAATPGTPAMTGGLTAGQKTVMSEAIDVLTAQGASIVDPADIPSIVTTEPERNLLRWPICSGTGDAKGQDDDCSVVFKYGMKRDFNAWLASLGGAAPVKTLTELRAWNRARERAGTLKYGQAQLDISDEMDVAADRARQAADRAKDVALTGPEGIDAAIKAHRLDALLFPGPAGAALAARPGYPTVIVPFGTIPNTAAASLPDGFAAKPSPFGVSFTGPACSEPRLIELAYAFEQATKRRVAPLPAGSR
jgi:amidase